MPVLVSIYPGARPEDVLEVLRGIHGKIGDAANVQNSAVARATAYLGWANDSVRMLEHRVSAADIGRLLLTSGYERILTATGILAGDDTATQGVLSGLLRREIERQGEVLAEAVKDLQEQIRRWPPNRVYAVADTSFYIDHEHKLEDIDLADHARATWPDKVITLIVPIIVLDELDGLKNRGPNHHVKWRAGHTLAVFDRIFAKPGGHHRHPADVRHRPGREGTQRRTSREQAQLAPRARTRRPAQEKGLAAALTPRTGSARAEDFGHPCRRLRKLTPGSRRRRSESVP